MVVHGGDDHLGQRIVDRGIVLGGHGRPGQQQRAGQRAR
jgi:hypothetical protein